jgi:hypothetical protein
MHTDIKTPCVAAETAPTYEIGQARKPAIDIAIPAGASFRSDRHVVHDH